MKRVPMPASGSASCTPSGVAIVAAILILHARVMSPERFEAERGRDLGRARRGAAAGGRPAGAARARTGCGGSARSTAAAAADLAFARRRFPRRPAGRAAGGAGAARARGGLRALGPARVAVAASSRAATGGGWPSGRGWCFAAWALLLVPALPGAAWGAADAPTAAGLIPGEFQAAADPPAAGPRLRRRDGRRRSRRRS